MKLSNCHNFRDFRKLAKKKLPSPIFHYIDGAADDDEGGRDQLLRRALGAERGGGVLRAGGGAHAILQ